MTVAPTKTSAFTAESFVAWSEAREEDASYELLDGAVVAMGAERADEGAPPCDPRPADGGPRPALRGFPGRDGGARRRDDGLEPDVLVRCGARLGDETVLVTDPIIVVEVASPSTQRIDVLVKLARYFRNASLVHYLIVLPTARLVVHHRRGAEGAIETASYDGKGTVALDPPGLTLELATLFPPTDAPS